MPEGKRRDAAEPDTLVEAGETELRRITIKVSDELYESIRSMARERNVTITELIKRALVVDEFFHRRRDHQVVLEKDGSRTEVVLLL